ncbi:hypothetical protein QQX98_000663 [Neonectria punicea]|uniref:Uncharacterized protein n=1 Tax=Neonectria punicea TaxID=979145 RepID=A0ABR1HTN1_9HYPO
MSLQVTTGANSLVGLGFGVSDVVTIWSLGQRFGNWMTAASGDRDFLQLLDLDELDILRRRGLVDTLRFNKKWGSEMFLLANDKAVKIEGKPATESLEKLGHFTAIMVCVTASLDAFAYPDLVKSIIRTVLSELLRTAEYGDDIVASQYAQRINSWRSSAIVRGLSTETRRIRRHLLQQKAIVDGLMPRGDARHMVSFLCWLIADKSESYVTSSSDVAGVAWCLSQIGIDVLSVSGLGEPPGPGPIRLEYNPEKAKLLPGHTLPAPAVLSRPSHTTVNLHCPEECFSQFPVDAETANRCRMAWKEGQKASAFVACWPVIPAHRSGHPDKGDLQYIFHNTGSVNDRVYTEIYRLASGLGFVINKELCQRLERTFQHESLPTLIWLHDEVIEDPTPEKVFSRANTSDAKINAFTVLQAFFMGYYYGIALELVDTSMLQCKTVDGAWGFGSPALFAYIQARFLTFGSLTQPGIRGMPREDVLSILSSLLLGRERDVSSFSDSRFNNDAWCVGVVDKRALLANSLIKPCRTPKDVGKFVLLDVDVSGIPVNANGLVRPGVPDKFQAEHSNLTDVLSGGSSTSNTLGPEAEDATFHIEADWDGDPESVLMCVRYRGRRLQTINPATADVNFLDSLVRPVEHNQEPEGRPPEEQIPGSLWTVSDFINRGLPPSTVESPTWLHMTLSSRPRLRYFVSEMYSSIATVHIATNSVQAAKESCVKSSQHQQPSHCRIVLMGNDVGLSYNPQDWYSVEIQEKIRNLWAKEGNNKRVW